MNRRKPAIGVNEVAVLDTRKFSEGLFKSLNIEYHNRGWYVRDDMLNVFPFPQFLPCDELTAEILELLWIRSRRRKQQIPEPLGRPHSRNRARHKNARKPIHSHWLKPKKRIR